MADDDDSGFHNPASPIAGRLMGILHFIENPCNEPWTVFVEASQPWANKAAMSFLSLDLMQTVRTGLSPGGKRTGRHMRGGTNAEHPSKSKVPGFPDPYEYLGHQLKKKTEGWIEANATWGSRAIFTVVGKIESGLWQFMLIDQATKFLYHSLADARKSEYCRRWHKGSYLRSGPALFQIASGWVAMDIFIQHYQEYPISGGVADAYLASTWQGTLQVCASFSGIAVGGDGTQIHGFRLRNVATGEVLAQIGPNNYATFEPVEFVLECTVSEPNQSIFVEYLQEFGALAGEGIIMGIATGHKIEPPKPPVKPTKWHFKPKKPARDKTGVHHTQGGGTVYDVPTVLAHRKRHPPK